MKKKAISIYATSVISSDTWVKITNSTDKQSIYIKGVTVTGNEKISVFRCQKCNAIQDINDEKCSQCGASL